MRMAIFDDHKIYNKTILEIILYECLNKPFIMTDRYFDFLKKLHHRNLRNPIRASRVTE